jgi:hypothetical protein
MQPRQKEDVVVVTPDRQTYLVTVRLPTVADIEATRPVYDRAYKRAVRRGDIKRDELAQHARQVGVWDRTKQEMYDGYMKSLADDEDDLRDLPRDQARLVATRMRHTRHKAAVLRQALTELENSTAECQASKAQFAAMLCRCTTDAATGRPAFARRDERHPAWETAAGAMSRLLLGIDSNFELANPEDAFLLTAA